MNVNFRKNSRWWWTFESHFAKTNHHFDVLLAFFLERLVQNCVPICSFSWAVLSLNLRVEEATFYGENWENSQYVPKPHLEACKHSHSDLQLVHILNWQVLSSSQTLSPFWYFLWNWQLDSVFKWVVMETKYLRLGFCIITIRPFVWDTVFIIFPVGVWNRWSVQLTAICLKPFLDVVVEVHCFNHRLVWECIVIYKWTSN